MNIVFFVRHFTERGTEVALFDYAKYNETILKNKSIIVCFTPRTQSMIRFPSERTTYDKFKSAFDIIEIDHISNMNSIINEYKIDYFYTLTHGNSEEWLYQFKNKNIWGNCKTIKHCVFDTTCPEGDFYISISNGLNKVYGTNLPVIPHMVNLPDINENLREKLNISSNAFVFGRYGAYDNYNINFAVQAIRDYLNTNPNTYFIFMNTKPFYFHSKIIYLDMSIKGEDKVKFINTCDAMLHVREDGETFGLSVAEFSSRNKPVITYNKGHTAHIDILGDKCIIYDSYDSLMNIFINIKSIVSTKTDWNAYRDYCPEKVMNLFQTLIFDK